MANQTADRSRSHLEPHHLFGLRGTPEYKEWLASLTEKTLISTSVIVRDALAMWAQSRGLPAPPTKM